MKNRQFIVEIEHTVYVDNYTEGEGEEINSYNTREQVTAENQYEAVNKVFGHVLIFDFDINKCATIDDNHTTLNYSVLVDNFNVQIKSNTDLYNKWVENKAKLFSNLMVINCYELIPQKFSIPTLTATDDKTLNPSSKESLIVDIEKKIIITN